MKQVKIDIDTLFELIYSNQRLGDAEYRTNLTYNESHYHYKAEKKIVEFLHKNDLWESYLLFVKVKQSLVD